MPSSLTAPMLSVVMPVGKRVDELDSLVSAYSTALRGTSVAYEIVAVLDGPNSESLSILQSRALHDPSIRIVELSRSFGEAAALMAGFEQSHGDLLMTLPAYYQVEPAKIGDLLLAFSESDDMLIAVRSPRAGSFLERLRRLMFHRLFQLVSQMQFQDLGCGVRLLRRDVAKEVALYGDQHRFLPALAQRRGFRVREVDLAQSPKDRFRGRYPLKEYVHRILDVLTVFFLMRFTKKPLRFFGTVGFLAAGFGAILIGVMVFQRIFLHVALGDRPGLLLASLLVVVGVQTFALGLIGELIIFTHASEMKEYAIRSIIQYDKADGHEPTSATQASADAPAKPSDVETDTVSV